MLLVFNLIFYLFMPPHHAPQLNSTSQPVLDWNTLNSPLAQKRAEKRANERDPISTEPTPVALSPDVGSPAVKSPATFRTAVHASAAPNPNVGSPALGGENTGQSNQGAAL